ncbi:AbrB/MazE/SpoVT family DNA-binding domain-containing protein [Sandaracinobacteroides saxicola]|uniref:AbrB/MazE/SpoVT family DNA-binding domain-containing protein n=2 Tax=Sandaracinobacteroides saxicola TaxID=2759707 RepID=A0A7G5IMA9_9SPHN|nr:AbrB/MazE/SpoVT family DNA-binding domain-containing protein [Sandaracinobacteroides saxicola]
MATVKTRTFKSGNSEAIRVPRELAFGIGTEVEIERKGVRLIVTPTLPDRLSVTEMLDALARIGPSPDGIQAREPFEYPDRPGLFD